MFLTKSITSCILFSSAITSFAAKSSKLDVLTSTFEVFLAKFVFLVKAATLSIFKDTYNLLKSKHSHKKRKDSLETRAVLLTFSLDLEMSGVVVHTIHQNNVKWWLLLGTA